MHSRIPNLMRAIQEHPWAILPTRLAAILDVLERRAQGIELAAVPPDAVQAARAAGPTISGKVAILQVFGILGQRLNMVAPMSGPATSTEQLGLVFDQLIASPDIRAIVLQIDSPGGEVYGTAELAAKILAGREQKRVIAIADSLAASAAYWIGSAASQFWVTPSGEVGSIGVYAVHYDMSKANELDGITPTYVSAGEFKLDGNPDAPLSDDARAAMQARVDEYYEMFIKSVAKGRGVSVSTVRGGFGRGRVVGATEAVAAGMVDRVGTLEDVLRSLRAGPPVAESITLSAAARRRRLALAELDQDVIAE